MTAANAASSWDLVAAAQHGDREAFGQLYARYAPELSRFLSGRVFERDRVEDFTAETFTRALRRIDSVSDQGKDPGAWFTTIARNLIFDDIKSSRHKLETPTAEIRDADSSDLGPEQTVIARETAAEVRRHVAHLTPDQRQAIHHRFFEDLSVPETAAVMGRNEGAVKALQHRGITALRAAMTAGTAPVPRPRDTGQQLASARHAVAGAHQMVAVDGQQVAEVEQAQQRAQYRADDHAAATGLAADLPLTDGAVA